MSQPAVFQVQVQGGPSYPVHAPELVVGTGAGCGLALRDPVASERHCRFAVGPEGFQVEDLGSATGTWVNGLPADGPTRVMEGDTVVAGVTRLRVGKADRVLNLAVEEAEFHYAKSGAGGAHRDADDWVRSEVGFGKIPAIRASGWLATVALLLLLGALAVGVVPDESLMPGALVQGHADLFDTELVAARAGDAAWLAMAERAQEEGCAVCHVSFDGPVLTNCASCHEDHVSGDVHPFHTTPGEYPEGELASDSCMLCHSEHRGPVKVMRAHGRDVARSCSECHVPEQLDELSRIVADLTDGQEAEPPEMVSAPIGYRDFDHSLHLALEGVSCATCHEEDAPAGEGDFATVRFETCMGCHDASGERAEPGWASVAALVPDDLRFDLDWHGTDQGTAGCEQCHTSNPKSGAFRVVTSPREELAFRLRRNHHAELFAARGERDCIKCHRTGAPSGDEGLVEGTFYHGVHLTDLDPAEGDADALSASCAHCHERQMTSESLLADRGAAEYHGLLLENCATCHSDTSGELLIDSVGARTGSETIDRVDFSHALHAETVEGGCFRCHSFTDPENLFAARPTTPESVRDCTECHSGHRNLGGGGCIQCHASVGGEVAAVFRGEPALRLNQPVRSETFSHRTEGHASQSCEHCHADVYRAQDVPSIEVPYKGQDACNVCHGGGSFHFSR